MPISILILMNLALVLGTVLLCVAPVTLRSGIFFGVTVAPEFRRTQDARRILWRYRRSVIIATLVCITALWVAVPRLTGIAAPLTSSGLVFLQVGAAIIATAIASSRVRPFASVSSQSPTRTASLRPRPQTLPGGPIAFAGPMLIVAATHFLLFTRHDTLLAETYRAALALLLAAYVANALFIWVAWLVLLRTRHIYPSGSVSEQENADKRFGYVLRLMFAYEFSAFMVAMVLSVAKITPALKGPRLAVILWAAVLIQTAIILVLVIKRRGTLEAPTPGQGDSTSDACWKYGLIYYNPDDPAFVVGTRTGPYGCDFNFGNKWSWVVSFGLVAMPILIRLVWF
jgi:uncharacterized membrane protein